MNKLFVLFIAFMMFQGCANYSKHTVFNDTRDQAYQLEEVSSWGVFAPTYQIQRAKVCEVKKTHIQTTNHGTGYESLEAVNCRLLNETDGYHKDLGTPVGPTVMQTGATVGMGALIGSGLSDSGDTVNNSQSQSQSQGQIGINQNTNTGGCVGNCGGKK